MATLEKRGKEKYRLVFWYQGERYQGAIKADRQSKAEQLRRRVEGNLELLEQGRLEYRPGDDLLTLMLSDGKINGKPTVSKRVTIGEFFDEYKANRPPGKEGSTRYTEDIHVAHLRRLLGEQTPVADVNTAALQKYVTMRSTEKSRLGETISDVTVRKELGTLSSIWNQWGTVHELVPGPLSLRQLKYDKRHERPPFQTWEQIDRRIVRGQLSKEEQDELWDCLYLSVEQVDELLTWVRQQGCLIRKKRRIFPWVHPMLAFCAYTGARRSEMLRCRLEDLDFEAATIQIREKKKDPTRKETSRHVPVPAQLQEILQDWIKVHPGGPLTFCKEAGAPLTVQMTQHYFQWAVAGGKWAVVRGFHVFRHSIISNLAARGVSDNVIQALAGHLNRDTTRRYLHLRPQTLEAAVGLLFGKR
ncbi:hypothetical protein BH10PLA2_BH10PLA2_27640 [soil metagenome]